MTLTENELFQRARMLMKTSGVDIFMTTECEAWMTILVKNAIREGLQVGAEPDAIHGPSTPWYEPLVWRAGNGFVQCKVCRSVYAVVAVSTMSSCGFCDL